MAVVRQATIVLPAVVFLIAAAPAVPTIIIQAKIIVHMEQILVMIPVTKRTITNANPTRIVVWQPRAAIINAKRPIVAQFVRNANLVRPLMPIQQPIAVSPIKRQANNVVTSGINVWQKSTTVNQLTFQRGVDIDLSVLVRNFKMSLIISPLAAKMS